MRLFVMIVSEKNRGRRTTPSVTFCLLVFATSVVSFRNFGVISRRFDFLSLFAHVVHHGSQNSYITVAKAYRKGVSLLLAFSGPRPAPPAFSCMATRMLPAYDSHDVAMALLIVLIAAILLSVLCCIVIRERGASHPRRMPPRLPTRERKPKAERMRKVEKNREENWRGSRARQPTAPSVPSQPAEPRPPQLSRPACQASSKSEAWVQAPYQAQAYTPKRQSTVVLRGKERHEDCVGLNHRADESEVLSSSLWAAAVLRRVDEGE